MGLRSEKSLRHTQTHAAYRHGGRDYLGLAASCKTKRDMEVEKAELLIGSSVLNSLVNQTYVYRASYIPMTKFDDMTNRSTWQICQRMERVWNSIGHQPYVSM